MLVDALLYLHKAKKHKRFTFEMNMEDFFKKGLLDYIRTVKNDK